MLVKHHMQTMFDGQRTSSSFIVHIFLLLFLLLLLLLRIQVNSDALSRSEMPSIEAAILKKRHSWWGHATRMIRSKHPRTIL